MPKVDQKGIHYQGYKEDPLPSGKTLDVEKRNYPEGAWDDELKKVIVNSPSRPHDREVFEKSNAIMSERDFRAFFNRLEVDASYMFSSSQKISELFDFFSYESNKYISKILHDSCARMLNALNELTKFLWESGLFFDGPIREDGDCKMKLWRAYEIKSFRTPC